MKTHINKNKDNAISEVGGHEFDSCGSQKFSVGGGLLGDFEENKSRKKSEEGEK